MEAEVDRGRGPERQARPGPDRQASRPRGRGDDARRPARGSAGRGSARRTMSPSCRSATYEYFADRDPLDAGGDGPDARRRLDPQVPPGRRSRSARRLSRRSLDVEVARCRELFIERTRDRAGGADGPPLDDVRLAVMMLDGIEIADRTQHRRAGDHDRGREDPARAVGGLDRERDAGLALLADLVDRGLDPEQAILFVIDGWQGAAQGDQRCVRRARPRAPLSPAQGAECHRPAPRARPPRSSSSRGAPGAGRTPTTPRSGSSSSALALELDRTWPDAAASLREGMERHTDSDAARDHRQAAKTLRSTNPCESMVRHEAPCERRERTNNSHPCRLEDRTRADAAARRSWGQSQRGIARWRREQPRQRSGRAALSDARVRASKTERQSESKAVVEAS